MKKIIFLFYILLCTCTKGIAQTSITGYSIYALGLEHGFHNNFGGEFRVFTNNLLTGATTELQFYQALKEHKYHQFRIGVGGNGNINDGEFLSLLIPLQLRIFPVQNIKQFSLIIEIAPQWFTQNEISLDNIALRHLWGIRYTFGKDE